MFHSDFFHYAFKSILATEVLFLLGLLGAAWFTVRLFASLKEEASVTRWTLLGIILLGLGLRLSWIAWTQPVPLSDFQVYWEYATRFYHGDPTFNVLSRHPGIMLVFAYAFHLFGASLKTVWLVNLLFSAVLLPAVFALARLMLGPRTALFAAFLAAVFPQLITYTALTATETVAVTFTLLLFWSILTSRDLASDVVKPQWLYWFALGGMLYAAILIRSTHILLLGLVPVVFWINRCDQWKVWLPRFAVLAATACLLLSTWVYHQYLVTGKAKLFFGDELWLACNVQYDRGGRYTHPRDMSFYPRVREASEQFSRTGSVSDEIRFYEVLGRETRKVIAADPGRYLREAFVRTRHILWTSQTGLRWTEKGSPPLQAVPEKTVKRMATVSNVWWQILLCLSPLGFFIAYCSRKSLSPARREAFWLIGLFLTVWLLFHYLIAVGSERYSFQVIPFVLILSSGVSSWFLQWMKISLELIRDESLRFLTLKNPLPK